MEGRAAAHLPFGRQLLGELPHFGKDALVDLGSALAGKDEHELHGSFFSSFVVVAHGRLFKTTPDRTSNRRLFRGPQAGRASSRAIAAHGSGSRAQCATRLTRD